MYWWKNLLEASAVRIAIYSPWAKWLLNSFWGLDVRPINEVSKSKQEFVAFYNVMSSGAGLAEGRWEHPKKSVSNPITDHDQFLYNFVFLLTETKFQKYVRQWRRFHLLISVKVSVLVIWESGPCLYWTVTLKPDPNDAWGATFYLRMLTNVRLIRHFYLCLRNLVIITGPASCQHICLFIIVLW